MISEEQAWDEAVFRLIGSYLTIQEERIKISCRPSPGMAAKFPNFDDTAQPDTLVSRGCYNPARDKKPTFHRRWLSILFVLSANSLVFGQWRLEVIASLGDCGRYNSLAIDSKGEPHLVYTDYTKGRLMYAYKKGGRWNYEVIDPKSGLSDGCALALDVNDRPHCAYDKPSKGALCYAYRNSAGWHSEVMEVFYRSDSSRNSEALCCLALELIFLSIAPEHTRIGRWPALALDDENRPHIICEDYSKDLLLHFWQSPTGWQIEVVDTTENFSGDNNSCLMRDRMGNFHIAYHRNSRVWFASKSGGNAWIKKMIDTIPVGAEIGMTLDELNYPHIVYGRGQYKASRPWHAWQDKSGWHMEQIESLNAHAFSIAYDSAGGCHIVYHSDDNLRYARKVQGSWYVENIYGPSQERQPALWHSTQFSKPHHALMVSCYDQKNGDLLLFSKVINSGVRSQGASFEAIDNPAQESIAAIDAILDTLSRKITDEIKKTERRRAAVVDFWADEELTALGKFICWGLTMRLLCDESISMARMEFVKRKLNALQLPAANISGLNSEELEELGSILNVDCIILGKLSKSASNRGIEVVVDVISLRTGRRVKSLRTTIRGMRQ